MHLVLLADASTADRQVLKKILVRDLGCRVIEAGTGLEAAASIESEHPDAVVMDVDLPQMNGFQLIECVRAAGGYRRIPVIVSAYVESPAVVQRLAELGVADLLAKPVNHELYRSRFRRVFKTVPARAGRETLAGPEAAPVEVVVLVDKDPNFRAFAVPLLEKTYQVVETSSGPTGLQAIANADPSIICVGQDLPFIDEQAFVKTARALPTSVTPGIFLLSQSLTVPDNVASEFDGVIQKSFVPDAFLAEFRRVVLRQESARDILVSVVTNDVRSEVISAVQHTIGVLSSQTVVEIEAGELTEMRPDLCARAELKHDNATLGLSMHGVRDHLGTLATGVLASYRDADVRDVLLEIVKTIVGRIRSSFEQRGIVMEQVNAELTRDTNLPSDDQGLIVPFATGNGVKFAIALVVNA